MKQEQNINKGTLFGIGVGPGDPEMMTLKAIRIIKEVDIICIPRSKKESSRAYQIAFSVVPEISEKKCIEFDFPMTKDKNILDEIHERIYGETRAYLLEGKSVAFLTIGDPTVYSTFSYIMEKAESDSFPVSIVSGITSFSLAAARLGISLSCGDNEIHIGSGEEDVEGVLRLTGTKVIMKCGRYIGKVKELLRKCEADGKTSVYAISDAGLPNESIYLGADEIPDDAGYMTTIIVK